MANVYTTGMAFTFGGTPFTVTNFTYSMTAVGGDAEQIDVSHLGLTTGAAMLSIGKPLTASTSGGDTGREVSIDYLGASPITDGSTGSMVVTGPTSLTANATVTSSSVTLATNEIVRGSATFKVARV